MLSAIALVVLALSDPATVQVEALKFDVTAIQKASNVEVKVKEKGVETTYKGVPLRFMIESHLKGPNEMADLRNLSDAVLLIKATDGYQAAVSAAEVAMDEAGAKYLLATEKDGKPLADKHGPVKLIIPGDPKPIRSVRMVSGVDLVRMPKK
jgi:Oxidoreductase molybdopterin binding domain